MDFLGCDKKFVQIFVQVPDLKRTLWVLFAEGAFLLYIPREWFNHEFCGLDYGVASFVTPLVDWYCPFKSLLFDENAFLLGISFGRDININVGAWSLFRKELRCLHDHLMTKGVGFGFVKGDILNIKFRFLSNFIHLKTIAVFILFVKFRNRLKLNLICLLNEKT